jgi:hypothetical protein
MRWAQVMSFAVIAALAACQAELPESGAPCPCVDGWACCLEVCIPQGEVCQGPDGGVGSDADGSPFDAPGDADLTTLDGGGVPDALVLDAAGASWDLVDLLTRWAQGS